MSKIIVIESVEALAEQVIKAIGLWEVTETDTRTKDEVVLSCLHPIEVPNEAEELVGKIIMLFGEAQIRQTDEAITQALAEAAALIESYGRRVPRAMLEFPRHPNKEGGWTIEYSCTEKTWEALIETDEYCRGLSMEEVESVLLFAEKFIKDQVDKYGYRVE